MDSPVLISLCIGISVGGFIVIGYFGGIIIVLKHDDRGFLAIPICIICALYALFAVHYLKASRSPFYQLAFLCAFIGAGIGGYITYRDAKRRLGGN